MALNWFKKEVKLGEVKLPKLEVKENPIGVLIVGQKEYTSKLNKYKDYAEFGYYAVPTVARCVNLLSESASGLKIQLKKVGKNGESEDVPNSDNHEIMKLLYRPNPKMGRGQFLASVFKDFYVFGNLCILADKSITKRKPTELWRANPTNMTIMKGNKGMPIAYKYENGMGKREFPVDQATGRSDMFHYFNSSLDDDWYGDSPMRSCRAWVDSNREAGEWNVSLLENSGRPSGALEYNGTTPLTDEQKSALKEQLESRNTGARNSGKPLLLTGGLEWQQIALSPLDMDFMNTLNYSDRKIADAYGIPFPLVSPDAATFSNMDTARESLYEDVIIPFMEAFLDTFNNWLIPQFPNSEGLYLCIDYNSISAYENKNERKANRLAKLVDDSLITIDESRAELGYEALPEGGDTVYINTGKVPIGFDVPNDSTFVDGYAKAQS